MAKKKGGAFQRFLELVLDTDSAKKLERDTQRALKKGTDPKAPVEQLSHIERGLNKLKIAAVGVGVAIVGGLALGLRKMVRESAEAQAGSAQLEAAIRSTGGAAGKTVGQLEDMASALQRQTTFSDDAIKGAEGLLLTFTKISGGTFDRATEAVLDFATAMAHGTGETPDLKAASLQVGKALQDPIKGITALTRAGVSFTQSQKDVIASLVATGDVAGAQAVILAELEKEFGGSAAAARDTLGGALTALGETWNDLFVVSRDSSDGIIRAINSISDVLPKLRDRADSALGALQRFWDGARRIREGNMRRLGRDEAADALLLDILAGEADIGVAGPPRRAPTPSAPATAAATAATAAAAAASAAAEATRTVAAMVASLTGATPATPGLGGVGIPLFDLTAQAGSAPPPESPLTTFLLDNFDEIQSAAQTAALGMQQAFTDAFLTIGVKSQVLEELEAERLDRMADATTEAQRKKVNEWYEIERANAEALDGLWETMARGFAASILTGIAQVAAAKVGENIAKALAATGEGLLGHPGGFPAAGNFLAAAAGWAALGGVAGAAASSVGGSGASSFRGSDVVGRQIDKLDRPEATVIVYVDGVDPKNPRHQALIGKTAAQYRERT